MLMDIIHNLVIPVLHFSTKGVETGRGQALMQQNSKVEAGYTGTCRISTYTDLRVQKVRLAGRQAGYPGLVDMASR